MNSSAFIFCCSIQKVKTCMLKIAIHFKISCFKLLFERYLQLFSHFFLIHSLGLLHSAFLRKCCDSIFFSYWAIPEKLQTEFFFNWDSLHARLNSHYEAWRYKKEKHKKIKPYWMRLRNYS